MPAMPALFTSTSILPRSRTASSTALVTTGASVTSTAAPLTGPGSADTAWSSVFRSRSQIRTVAPESSRRLVIARPMPAAPPVTMAVRPLKSSWFIGSPSSGNGKRGGAQYSAVPRDARLRAALRGPGVGPTIASIDTSGGPHMILPRTVTAVVAGLTLALAAADASAQADDHVSLKGMKELKVAFDLVEGDGKGLLNRLSVIDETRASLIKQGVTPNFVVTFRGPATRLVQTDMTKVKPEDREAAAKIAAKLQEMSRSPGVSSIEQCSVAIRQQETRAEDVLPVITVVGNSWISLMAYQSKGYAYIRP